jgi:hypothetical protein
MEAALAKKEGRAVEPREKKSFMSRDPIEQELSRADLQARKVAAAQDMEAQAAAEDARQRGGMDSMLAALRSGTAFANRGKPQSV